MAKVVEYTDEYQRGWVEYVESSPCATIAHHIGWKDVMENSFGYKPKYLLAIEGLKIKGILPLFVMKTWWRSRYIISLPWIDYGGICADGFKFKETGWYFLKLLITNYKFKKFSCNHNGHSNKSRLESAKLKARNMNWIRFCQKEYPKKTLRYPEMANMTETDPILERYVGILLNFRDRGANLYKTKRIKNFNLC